MAGLYIHIPFCHAKCAYCDFFSMPHNRMTDAYFPALRNEYEIRKAEIKEPFDTIYLGGGTPSSIGCGRLQQLLSWLPLENVHEFTIEVNPEDVTKEMADFIASSPINRVSMGVQSLADEELRFIGRRHTAEDAVRAYERLRSAGVDNISLDLIFGLPDQSVQSWAHTLDGSLSLRPEHISAYSLMIEEGTRLWSMKQSGRFEETDDVTAEDMYRTLCIKASEAGLNHYEISNFAVPGKESKHNSAYWDLTPYLGIGPGAHSFDGTKRKYNPWRLKEYIEANGDMSVNDEESLTNRVNDYIMIRLRTAKGLSITELSKLFGDSTARNVCAQAKDELLPGNLVSDGDRLYIPESRWLVSDPIIANLFQ